MTGDVLHIQDARRASQGIPALEAHIAALFFKRGGQAVHAFLDAAPARGQALVDLFLESGRTSFDDFVNDVIAGKYFWHGVGWNVGEIWRDMWTIGIESTRLAILFTRIGPDIATSVALGCLGFEVVETSGLHYDFDGFGPVEAYTGADGSSDIPGGNEEPDCEFPDTEILYGL